MDARAIEAGFTLVELMMVIAIGAVLLMLGAPTFATLKANVQTRTAEGQVTRALQHARHAAIMRSAHVLMCPSRDGQRCRSGFAWHAGWLVALDADHDGRPDPDTPPLVSHAALAPDVRVITSVGREQIVFRADGSASGSNASFTVCDAAAPGRAVIVSNTGRVRSAAAEPARLEACLASAP